MSHSFHQPHRQSPWAILFIIGAYLKLVVRQWWPLFLVIMVKPNPQKTSYFLFGVLAIAVFMIIRALIQHVHYRFWIQDDRLMIRQGWLQKAQKTIPLDRIQAVNLEQHLGHRLTNTSKVTVETAGSSGEEVMLRALNMTLAEELRTLLFQPSAPIKTESATEEVLPTDEPIISLSFIDLLKTGLTENHLRTLGIVLAVLLGIYDDISQYWTSDETGWMEEAGAAMLSVVMLTVLGVTILMLVILASVVKILLQFADAVLYDDGQRFRLHAGLITIKEVVIHRQKLQSVAWSQHVLQRLFGLYRLTFRQALPEITRGQKEVMLPGVYGHHIQTINQRVFTEEGRENGSWFNVDRRYRLYLWMWRGIFGLIVGSVLFFYFQWWALIIFIWWIWSWIAITKRVARWHWYLNEDILVLCQGWLKREVILLPIYKIQNISLDQGPIQRKWGLKSVTLHTASGIETIPWIPEKEAHRLRDWCLYRVEKDSRGWM